ncbi:MAG: carboxypeptidase-like regulatory domain-containing protein [Prolixibacteraceae bacterium]|nr:carboxypeptidase-like regulatory domain-containing protein [Prolixibacteraceae bacterium]
MAFILSALWLSFPVSAQTVFGKITNTQNEPVPYATIFVSETREGTISNVNGDYSLKLQKGPYHFTVRSLGYLQIEQKIDLITDSLRFDIVLQPQEYQIKEVKVFPGKEDPAYFIIRKAMANAAYFRGKNKHYEADLYIKSNFTFTNIPKLYQNQVVVNDTKLKDAFKEDVTYVIESQNKITYNYPDSYKQEVISKRSSLSGFDEPPIMGLMTSTFYEERPNGVISPLSATALNHYNYKYEGFITVGKFDIFKIKVEPKRKSDELVSGTIYIVDQLWCIYNIDFNARIEFFSYRIQQQYENIGNENWMPVSHIIQGDFALLGLKGKFYYGATLKYNLVEENDLISLPKITTAEEDAPKKITNTKEIDLRKEVSRINAKEELTNQDVRKVARLNRKILKQQYRDSTFTSDVDNNYKIEEPKDTLAAEPFLWDSLRTIPLTPAEIRSYEIRDSLAAMEKRESGTKKRMSVENSVVMKILNGYPDMYKDSTIRVSYSGLISAANADYNAVDGYKYKQSFHIFAGLDSGKTISVTPEMGYAFNRKALFWSVETRFQNLLLKNNQLEISTGKKSRDFKFENHGIDPNLNSVSTWFFGENYMKLYETGFFRINTTQKTFKNLYFSALINYNHFSSLENNAGYTLSDKKEYSPNIPKGLFAGSPALQQQKSWIAGLGMNYRKNQNKPWLQTSAFLMISDFYNIQLSYKQGIKGFLNSVSDFNQVDFKFRQQANLSPASGIDWHMNAGYFFRAGQLHFSQFKHFKTSEIVVPFQTFTHTFQLLNDYEFSTSDKYINAGFEYRTEYLFMRYISLFNKRTWSESLHLNYLATPVLNKYWEAGYSLNNVFFVGNLGIFAGFKGSNFESFALKFSISAM